jgi:hypothetical protein
MCIRRRAKKLVSCGAVLTACVIVFTMWRGSNFPESGGAPPHSKALRAKEIFSCVPAFLIKPSSTTQIWIVHACA